MLVYKKVSKVRYVNVDFLAYGVKNAHCLAAGSLMDVVPSLNGVQRGVITDVLGRLVDDETTGTIEVFDNDALNIFIKQDHVVTGYYRWRSE